MDQFTHFNEEGRAKMVEVGNKLNTKREAIATGSIYMMAETLNKIIDREISKGDVLAVSQVAGIMAAKKTSDMIPMCHNIILTGADIHFNIDRENNKIDIQATVRTTGKTGVEIEALNAVSTAALTIYDMCKAVDRGMEITGIKLMKKTGGKSGDFIRE
ncbi:cyclic pyranopterin monophosphate synthase MoaC [Clostridium formicaceticum]|uniref:Cyclic pyranopterin monophosphate synthase n=1 Tax=Clostridium formicaceticum TaxID=1497 RepID=A0AAC9WFY5_9CLOT|nr:cyclic pyranopterin monophosphate synthase MoaC [Clostridium formicaceticum]AOY76758.1 molybdenum cofactor biosynthesis protein C [Clostridium formicaceticum]ARE87209.1 Cyclic pyranopterin monophosphate synthase accessory protein [Clostridium formicaceticum]